MSVVDDIGELKLGPVSTLITGMPACELYPLGHGVVCSTRYGLY